MSMLTRHSSRQRETRTGLSAEGLTSYTNRPRNRHRYCGKEKDSESGLYYYGARYYESWTCRFVSVDPLAEKYAQLSSYNYADNSPVTDLDVDGLQTPHSKQSQQGQARDHTATASPVKQQLLPKSKVNGVIAKPKGREHAAAASTSVGATNIKPKLPSNNLPNSIKGLSKFSLTGRVPTATIGPGKTQEEKRAEAIKGSAWAWGPFAMIGVGMLGAPVVGSATVGSGTGATMAIKGGANVFSQLLEHNFNYKKLDVVDVGLATVPGFKGLNATQMAILTNAFSGAFDITLDGNMKAVGINKSAESAGVDAVAGFVGNKAGRSLSSSPITGGINPDLLESLGGEFFATATKATIKSNVRIEE